MTGGLGFTKTGQELYKKNRNAGKWRTRKNSQLSGVNSNQERSGRSDYEEISNWNNLKRSGAKRQRFITFSVIAILVTGLSLYLLLS